MKTLIAIPCMDQVPVPFCHSLAVLTKPAETTIAMNPGSLVYMSRDKLAQMAIESEADYVFWMDSDMQFPQDCLMKMMDKLQRNDLDILCGLYFRRVPPYTPVLFDRLERENNDVKWSEFQEIPKEIFEVGGCGFGCVLMKTDVFFDVLGATGAMFMPIGSNGEDVSFCIRARECGYKIFCDPSIVCGHVGYSVIDDKFYEAYKGGLK